MESLSNLYQEKILQLNAQPFHYEKRTDAQYIVEAYNPLCGDKFKLYLDIEKGIIIKAYFHGYGCAISKAATSILIQQIENKSIDTVLDVIKTYFSMLSTEGVKVNEENEAMKPFLAVKSFPERLTCATLSWQAAKDFLSTQ